MQPFDALTIRAVLEEAKPLILNRKVDKLFQLGRDEVILPLRSRAGMVNLFLCAQASFGRICLVKGQAPGEASDRYGQQRSPGLAHSHFATGLRKHLTGATLVGVEQLPGERVVDFVFSTTDEVGTTSLKVLTAEIMGRHSNLIFWDKQSEKIIGASHVVTKEMSRQREIAPGLRYERPPGQDKPNVFRVEESDFFRTVDDMAASIKAFNAAGFAAESKAEAGGVSTATPVTAVTAQPYATVEQWLIHAYTGLGRHLAEELVCASGAASALSQAAQDAELKHKLWKKITQLRQIASFSPTMRKDLGRYSVISWWPDCSNKDDWEDFPAVNDLIEQYYRAIEAREQFQQLKERLRQDLKGETDKLQTRISAAGDQMGQSGDFSKLKKYGDMILANLHQIGNGQEILECDDLYENGGRLSIQLNPNLSASQNAQNYYRQFAKNRARQTAAVVSLKDANARLDKLKGELAKVDAAASTDELRRLKDSWLGRKPKEPEQRQRDTKNAPAKHKKQKLMSVVSSDGWTIYVGRNRQENDHLLSRVAQPLDLWFHILGLGGAHVLIRVPSGKQEPPLTTIKEAAQVAARLSKAAAGSKVRVVYTQARYVKKLPKEQAGTVRYENEKTIEVDTSLPMPKCMKSLFN